MSYSARPPGGCLIGGLNKDATLLMSHGHNEHVKAKFDSISVSDREELMVSLSRYTETANYEGHNSAGFRMSYGGFTARGLCEFSILLWLSL